MILDIIKQLYENGNSTINIESNETTYKITYRVESDGKLSCQCSTYMNKMPISKDIKKNIEKDIIKLAPCIVSSIFDPKTIDATLSTEPNRNIKEEAKIKAINELYRQIRPVISIDRNNIEDMLKNLKEDPMGTLENKLHYFPDNGKEMNVDEILFRMALEFAIFLETMEKAHKIYEKANTGTPEEQKKAKRELQEFFGKLPTESLSKEEEDQRLDEIITRKDPYDETEEKTENDQETESETNSETPTNIIPELKEAGIPHTILTSNNYIVDPSVGRDSEMKKLETVLLTPEKSPVLVGQPGVGKTAIVEGLAYRIATDQVPTALQGKKILGIDTSKMVQGCSFVGMLEARVNSIMNYLVNHPDTILFIDEIHTTIGAGTGSKSNIDLANIMKPYIGNGSVKIIGATTIEEYNEYFKTDKAFNRRFQPIKVDEPKKEIISQILENTTKKYAEITKVEWGFDETASNLIFKHIIDCTAYGHRVYDDIKYNPDLSIGILGSAFALSALNNQESVTIESIAEAIKMNDSLYEHQREAAGDYLLKCYKALDPTKAKEVKILQFDPTRKKSK